jgi:putative tricarboxylic transport membrane protein
MRSSRKKIVSEQAKKILQGEILAGLLLAALGVFILLESFDLEYTSDFGPGPGFLPFWLGIIISVFSALLILVTIRKPFSPESSGAEASGNPRRSLIGWVAMALTVPLLTLLGFYISFAILSAFLVLTMERRSAAVAVAVAVGCASGFYLIFSLALGVPLPSAPWGIFR